MTQHTPLLKRARIPEMMDKMAPMPANMTHIGLANVQSLGLTIVVAADGLEPLVWHPLEKTWHPLLTRTERGLLI